MATGGALAGVRVLELGQLVAGPFAGFLLAGFGADVIKVEAPGDGDAIRRWRKMVGDTSLWFRTLGRNKRSITCNLRVPQGQQIVRDLVTRGEIDVLLENFKPGTMERWGLGPQDLQAVAPGLVYVRVSGYGQTGPLASRPGFANVAEAFGGLRYVSGDPEGPPMRTGVSIGDTLAGLHAAFGALAALRERDESRRRGGEGTGQVVDVALYESVLSIMESLVPEADVLGHVRTRSGNRLPGIVPSGTYPCRGDAWVVIGANADSMFRALMRLVGRDDLADDPGLAHNDGRVDHAARIDDAIVAWTSERDADAVLRALDEAGVPSGPIHTAADLLAHPQLAARDMIERVTLPDGTTAAMPRIVPLLSRTPARTRFAGPDLGAHTEEVLRDLLGRSDAEIDALRAQGAI